MKMISNAMAYLSVALNVTYLTLWIYISNRHVDFVEAKERFLAFMPFSHGLTVIVLVLLSIYSLIVFARGSTVFAKVLAFLQSFFIFMFIWQYL